MRQVSFGIARTKITPPSFAKGTKTICKIKRSADCARRSEKMLVLSTDIFSVKEYLGKHGVPVRPSLELAI